MHHFSHAQRIRANDFSHFTDIMDPEQRQFLTFTVLPACLSAQQTAWYLGFGLHDIRPLVANGILKPLGRPARTSSRFFALVELEQLRTDVKRLSKARDAVQTGWRRKNGTESEHQFHSER